MFEKHRREISNPLIIMGIWSQTLWVCATMIEMWRNIGSNSQNCHTSSGRWPTAVCFIFSGTEMQLLRASKSLKPLSWSRMALSLGKNSSFAIPATALDDKWCLGWLVGARKKTFSENALIGLIVYNFFHWKTSWVTWKLPSKPDEQEAWLEGG